VLDVRLVLTVSQIVLSILAIAVTIPLLIAATKNSRPAGILLPWLILNVITILTIIGVGMSIFLLQLDAARCDDWQWNRLPFCNAHHNWCVCQS
jgi:hypothetical protein